MKPEQVVFVIPDKITQSEITYKESSTCPVNIGILAIVKPHSLALARYSKTFYANLLLEKNLSQCLIFPNNYDIIKLPAKRMNLGEGLSVLMALPEIIKYIELAHKSDNNDYHLIIMLKSLEMRISKTCCACEDY